MHAVLICPEDTLSTDIWTMTMDYAVWVYNRITDIQSGLSAIEVLPRPRFEAVSETLGNYHFRGCPTYVLEPNFQKPGLKIPGWDPRSRSGVNIGFSYMHSTLVGFFLNLITGSILPQYYVVFDDMFSTVISSTAAEP